MVPSPSAEEPVPDLASDPVPVPAAKAPEDKPAAAAFSRFSVSRFSITHVSDSDMDSAGGRCCSHGELAYKQSPHTGLSIFWVQ